MATERHNLKILPQYFDAVTAGLKRFEIRKNDRKFKPFDEIRLNEIDGPLGKPYKPTGRFCLVRITYILTSDHGNEFAGLEAGYCILGTELIYVP